MTSFWSMNMKIPDVSTYKNVQILGQMTNRNIQEKGYLSHNN